MEQGEREGFPEESVQKAGQAGRRRGGECATDENEVRYPQRPHPEGT